MLKETLTVVVVPVVFAITLRMYMQEIVLLIRESKRKTEVDKKDFCKGICFLIDSLNNYNY
jgi:hypothetical protein